jgi:hypothetical protein
MNQDAAVTVAAVAKITQEIAPEAKKFIEKILGPGAEEIGMMLGDNMRLRRFKNQLRVFERAYKMAHDAGLKPNQVDLKFLVPFLNNASIETDLDMAERWAALLANTSSSTDASVKNHVFPHLLSQMSQGEAHALEYIQEEGKVKVYQDPAAVAIAFGAGRTSMTGQEFLIARDNLQRLGLIQEIQLGMAPLPISVRISPLGEAFLCARRKPVAKS